MTLQQCLRALKYHSVTYLSLSQTLYINIHQLLLERHQLKLHPSTLAIYQPTEKLYSCCYLFTVFNSGLLFYIKHASTTPSQQRQLPSPTHSWTHLQC